MATFLNYVSMMHAANGPSGNLGPECYLISTSVRADTTSCCSVAGPFWPSALFLAGVESWPFFPSMCSPTPLTFTSLAPFDGPSVSQDFWGECSGEFPPWQQSKEAAIKCS